MIRIDVYHKESGVLVVIERERYEFVRADKLSYLCRIVNPSKSIGVCATGWWCKLDDSYREQLVEWKTALLGGRISKCKDCEFGTKIEHGKTRCTNPNILLIKDHCKASKIKRLI